jgi:hypothetical protein
MLTISCPNSLNKFNQMAKNIKKKKILMRFVMDGCQFCTNSQQDWDSMCSTVNNRFKITPDNVISQIDSAFANELINTHQIMDTNNSPYSVSGFPDYVVVVNGVAIPHEKRDTNSLIDTLISNRMIVSKFKSKRKKKRKQKRSRKLT